MSEMITLEAVMANIRQIKAEIAVNPSQELWGKLLYEYDLYDMLVCLKLNAEEEEKSNKAKKGEAA